MYKVTFSNIDFGQHYAERETDKPPTEDFLLDMIQGLIPTNGRIEFNGAHVQPDKVAGCVDHKHNGRHRTIGVYEIRRMA
jgi:hypothetical protein